LKLIDVTDAAGRVVEPEWLRKAEAVFRQLRESLPCDCARRLGAVFSGGGRMTLAVEGNAVRSLAVWRLIDNICEGRRFHFDDLVTDVQARSRGAGARLLAALEERAVRAGSTVVALDSGTQRVGAHKFYFGAGYVIPSFSFRKTIT